MSEPTDLFGDEQIHTWMMALKWLDVPAVQAVDFIENTRRPISDLAATLNLDPVDVAGLLTVHIFSGIQGRPLSEVLGIIKKKAT